VSFSPLELERYSRQFVMSEWSAAAQDALRSARVMVIGAGALGSPVATYLAAAGVGQIGIVDGDTVDLSNLHRQPLHYTPDVGSSKADSAAAKLGLVNPLTMVEAFPANLDEANSEAIVMGADAVVDCTDSFEARYLVNDACCAQAIPLVEAGVSAFEGLVLSIRPGESACYRCAFPDAPPEDARRNCREAGVLGAMAGIVGCIQALEALKLLSGVGEPLLDRILQLDGMTMEQTLVATKRRDGCPGCARVPSSAQRPCSD
jgi:molybdopterin-synthase adenylyltransferase